MAISTAERKKRVSDLRKLHENYFQIEGKINALYIPKMAYRPSGKDELHISFFPSEFEKGEDIYTEFVSIDYDTEDPKRTLYLHKHNPHWKDEYELIQSSAGFIRHIIPVNELKVINDVTSRGKAIIDFANPDLPNPDELLPSFTTPDLIPVVNKLDELNNTLKELITIIKNK